MLCSNWMNWMLFSLLIIFSYQQGGGSSGGSGSSSGTSGRRIDWNSMSSSLDGGVLAAIVLGSIFVVVVLAVLFWFCVPRCCAWMQDKKRYEKYRLKYDEKRSDFDGQFNYEESLRSLQSCLKDVQTKKLIFYFVKDNNRRDVNLNSVETVAKDKNHAQIELKGDDAQGTWKAKGGFMKTIQGPFFWMLKFYDDKKSAGQTGEFHTLVYESTDIRQGEVEGRWFYEGMETSAEYSGAWRIGSLELASAERILSDNVS